ncbi:hypothetical protein [Bacillus sp. JCM 19041]|uniref:hypothetical protein n=1 Tax=Bacillus sp. JCM 19041 TaxID=1460637 RepID=UPI0006D216C0
MNQDPELIQAVKILKLLHLVDYKLDIETTMETYLVEQDGTLSISQTSPCQVPKNTVLLDRHGYENMKNMFNRKEIAYLLAKQLQFYS